MSAFALDPTAVLGNLDAQIRRRRPPSPSGRALSTTTCNKRPRPGPARPPRTILPRTPAKTPRRAVRPRQIRRARVRRARSHRPGQRTARATLRGRIPRAIARPRPIRKVRRPRYRRPSTVPPARRRAVRNRQPQPAMPPRRPIRPRRWRRSQRVAVRRNLTRFLSRSPSCRSRSRSPSIRSRPCRMPKADLPRAMAPRRRRPPSPPGRLSPLPWPTPLGRHGSRPACRSPAARPYRAAARPGQLPKVSIRARRAARIAPGRRSSQPIRRHRRLERQSILRGQRHGAGKTRRPGARGFRRQCSAVSGRIGCEPDQ